MSEPTNWVEQRAHRERILRSEGPKVWGELRSALEDACNSYNEHYCPNKHEVECKLENGNRSIITKTTYADGHTRYRDERIEVIASFHQATAAVTVTRTPGTPHSFHISSDEQQAFLMEGKERVTPDEASRKILESVFFPSNQPRSPVSMPSSGPSGERGWM